VLVLDGRFSLDLLRQQILKPFDIASNLVPEATLLSNFKYYMGNLDQVRRTAKHFGLT